MLEDNDVEAATALLAERERELDAIELLDANDDDDAIDFRTENLDITMKVLR